MLASLLYYSPVIALAVAVWIMADVWERYQMSKTPPPRER